MFKFVFLLLMTMMLFGCKEGAGITCPTVRGYSASFLAATEKEVGMIEQTAPHVVRMLNDYGVERDAIRECLKRQKASRK